jgi:hypothetical protein
MRYAVYHVNLSDTVGGRAGVIEATSARQAEIDMSRFWRSKPERFWAEPSDDLVTHYA